MATKGKLISDIELRLTMGKPSDDFELERSQIGHWLDILRDEFVKAILEKDIAGKKSINSFYITKEDCLPAVVDDEDCEGDCLPEVKITLATMPMGLTDDKGIVRVATNAGHTVSRSTINMYDYLYDLPFSKPSEDNLVWRREGKSIYISGADLEDVDITYFTVYYVPQYSSQDIGEDAEFNVEGDLLSQILDEAEAIGRRQVYGSDEDLENDGEQDLTQ